MPSIIPKGLSTPELLAAIIVSKYTDGLPLYRMEDTFKRQGIDLPRQTMARWVIAVARACRPYEVEVVDNRLRTCDDIIPALVVVTEK